MAGSGLGKALALHYAKKGYRVAIGDINKKNLRETQTELEVHASEVIAAHCNTTLYEDLERVRDLIIEEWGGLDILFNNAGIAGAVGDIETLSIEDWHSVLGVNFFGVVNGCKAFSQVFKRQERGAIVNIASMAGLLTPPHMGPYNTSKSAVIALTETLKFELSPFNVNVHVVCPAFFQTNLTSSMGSSEKAKKFVNKLMDSSSINADDIAKMIDAQVVQNELMMLPHTREKNLWRLKRFFPNFFLKRAIKSFSASIRKNSV